MPERKLSASYMLAKCSTALYSHLLSPSPPPGVFSPLQDHQSVKTSMKYDLMRSPWYPLGAPKSHSKGLFVNTLGRGVRRCKEARLSSYRTGTVASGSQLNREGHQPSYVTNTLLPAPPSWDSSYPRPHLDPPNGPCLGAEHVGFGVLK